MIRINDVEYNDYKVKVMWLDFSVSNKNDKERFGKAPYITFGLDNILIEIEFTFSKEMFLNLVIDEEKNIKEYVSDINIKNDKGWKSLISEKYDCNITRINDKTFNLDFKVIDNEIKIFINTRIDL